MSVTVKKLSRAGRSWGAPGNNDHWSGRYGAFRDGVRFAVIYNRARKAYEPADWVIEWEDGNGRPQGRTYPESFREAKAVVMEDAG